MNVKLIPISSLNVNPLNSDEYINALNDHECNKYLEIRFHPQTYDTVKEYIENLPDNVRFFKIVADIKKTSLDNDGKTKYLPGDRWVGNIKLGPINMWHKFAEIGILIFPTYWHKGYGSEAIKEVSNYAFNVLHLHKCFAGCIEDNINSIRAFKNAGFEEEYRIRSQYYINGSGHKDDVVLSKFNVNEATWR